MLNTSRTTDGRRVRRSFVNCTQKKIKNTFATATNLRMRSYTTSPPTYRDVQVIVPLGVIVLFRVQLPNPRLTCKQVSECNDLSFTMQLLPQQLLQCTLLRNGNTGQGYTVGFFPSLSTKPYLPLSQHGQHPGHDFL